MVDGASSDQWVYVVTDIEVHGPWPGPNSMRSFASVAVSLDGREHGRFEAVLDELPAAELTAPNLPAGWLGDVEHTHHAIDDALGFAHLLVHLARTARERGVAGLVAPLWRDLT